MPYNGSGTFLRVRNWAQDATAGIRIRADRHDSEDDNFAQGLSQCITKDGQTTVTANLPMATFRHTNVGAAQNATDYARYDQVQLGKAVWAVAGGTADALTALYSPNTPTPVDGQLYYVRATAANATTTPTFSPDGNTAQVITKYGADPLAIGDISGAGHELILRYRLSDTKYELLNPAVTGVAVLSGNNAFTGNNSFSGDSTFTGDVRFPNDGTLTIASGGITVTGVYHTVDTEAAAATDDLETINGGVSGQILILRTADSARDVVLKSTGNIDLVADVTLSSIDSPIELIYDGATSKWLQRSATAAQGAKADTALQAVPASILKHSTTLKSATGTAVDHTLTETNVKEIKINFVGVSKSGTSLVLIQIGPSGGVETTGYLGAGSVIASTVGTVNSANGFVLRIDSAADTAHGTITLTLADPATNTWVSSGVVGLSNAAVTYTNGGSKAIANVINKLRVTMVNGTDTFDAGSISIDVIYAT